MILDKLNLTGSEYKTNWPLLLFIFLMPLRNIQLQYIPSFGPGLNLINILFILSLAHSIKHGQILEHKPRINSFLKWYIFTGIVALFFGYSFLGPSAGGLWKVMKDQLMPVFFLFIVQKSAQDQVQWNRIFVATLMPLPYCFKVVWNQYNAVSSWHYSHDLRISGTFMDLGANEMGAYSTTMALVSLGCLMSCWGNKKWRYIFIATFLFSGLSLLYSYSRGGYISFILGAIVILLKFKDRKKILLPLIIALVIGSFNLPKSVVERFSSIDAEEEERDESAQSRFVFWAIAFDKFLERPLFGYGYHTSQDIRINPHQMDTHNYYVKMLVERGVLGFVTFLILLRIFWNLAKRNLNYHKNSELEYGLILGISGAILALTLANMFGDRFSHYPMSTSLWIYIALITVIESRRITEESKKDDYI